MVIHSPGRVNLIGDHTDYAGLPVMPMAIPLGVTIAVADHPDRVGAESDRYGETLDVPRSALPTHPAGWLRYLVPVLAERARGALLLVSSDLPSAGGLASSTALSMGLTAALTMIDRGDLDRGRLITDVTRHERSVAVESGQMDQVVIAHGTADGAIRIDFNPIKWRTVPIPDDLAVVLAPSGGTAPKVDRVRDAYNLRVMGARLAAALIDEAPTSGRSLGAVGATLGDVTFLPEHLTAAEVAIRTGVSVERLVTMTRDRFDPGRPVPVRRFAHHMVTEAARVDEMEGHLRDNAPDRAGDVLDESARSLTDFGVSTEGLAAVTAAMREAGAWGARPTGAGLGGFAVAFVPMARVEAVTVAANTATGGPAFVTRPAPGLRRLDR